MDSPDNRDAKEKLERRVNQDCLDSTENQAGKESVDRRVYLVPEASLV